MTKPRALALIVIATMGVLLVGNASCQTEAPTEDQAAVCPPPMLAPPPAKIQQLTEEIRLLQLLNRMQFTAEQLTALLPVVDNLQKERGQFDEQIAALDTQLEQALTRQRELLVADKRVPADLHRRLAELQKQRAELQEQAQLALAQSGGSLRKLLTAPQLAIVTGSYEAQLQAREMLAWLRTLSDEDFTQEARANAEGLAMPEKGLTQDLLLQVFTTARKMSAPDFAKSENELTQRLAPVYGLTETEADGRLAATFASPHMPGLLREKAATAAGGAG
ncbi:MAG: hypothetical protein GX100_09745 [candidate division WS1 bacterium]|jgi:DNA repair exonuclease SbcCD ATPase subunit|nr:hypothetical protein [candidate division WS1 bacterium]